MGNENNYYLVPGSELTNIGDAIREKVDPDKKYAVDEMAAAIKGISTGVDLPDLTNPASNSHILKDKQAIDENGNILTGTIETKSVEDLTWDEVSHMYTFSMPAGYYPSAEGYGTIDEISRGDIGNGLYYIHNEVADYPLAPGTEFSILAGETYRGATEITPQGQNVTTIEGNGRTGGEYPIVLPTPVTIKNDSTLVSDNIKSGVKINGVTGTYSGDGCNHTFTTLTVNKAGTFDAADDGASGYTQVTVSDKDLIASNIKSGVEILGVTGTLDPTPVVDCDHDIVSPSSADLYYTGLGDIYYDGDYKSKLSIGIGHKQTQSGLVSAGDEFALNAETDIRVTTPNLNDLTVYPNGSDSKGNLQLFVQYTNNGDGYYCPKEDELFSGSAHTDDSISTSIPTCAYDDEPYKVTLKSSKQTILPNTYVGPSGIEIPASKVCEPYWNWDKTTLIPMTTLPTYLSTEESFEFIVYSYYLGNADGFYMPTGDNPVIIKPTENTEIIDSYFGNATFLGKYTPYGGGTSTQRAYYKITIPADALKYAEYPYITLNVAIGWPT